MKKILIPTDFSSNAAKAVKFAMRLAHNSTGIRLVFFHATDTAIPTRTPSRLYSEIVEEDMAEGLEKLKKDIHQHLMELDIKPEEIDSELVVVHGGFKENIRSEVKRLGIDLIIMGTRGASGLQKVLFGSNTVDVMEIADCPMLAIPDNYKYHPVKHIAYAADFLTVEEGFENIVSLAKMLNASVEIFHVNSILPRRIDHKAFDKAHFLDKLKKKFHYEPISLEFVDMDDEAVDDAMEGIQTYIAKKHPSILAMATYDRIWIEKLINPSFTKEMMFQTEIPLFAFKKTGS